MGLRGGLFSTGDLGGRPAAVYAPLAGALAPSAVGWSGERPADVESSCGVLAGVLATRAIERTCCLRTGERTLIVLAPVANASSRK